MHAGPAIRICRLNPIPLNSLNQPPLALCVEQISRDAHETGGCRCDLELPVYSLIYLNLQEPQRSFDIVTPERLATGDRYVFYQRPELIVEI